MCNDERRARKRGCDRKYRRKKREEERDKFLADYKERPDWEEQFAAAAANKPMVSQLDFTPIQENIDKYTHVDGYHGGSMEGRDTASAFDPRRTRAQPYRRAQKLPDTEKCKCTDGCGETCQNVAASEVCNEVNCIYRGLCENSWSRPRNQYLRLCVPRQQGSIEGKGLCALGSIPRGAVVGQYLGEVKIWNARASSRYCAQMSHDGRTYVIDARTRGNNTRFLNHSCDPNCELVQRTAAGKQTIWVKAVKPICEGEFLTIRYADDVSAFFDVCQCGSDNCISAKQT